MFKATCVAKAAVACACVKMGFGRGRTLEVELAECHGFKMDMTRKAIQVVTDFQFGGGLDVPAKLFVISGNSTRTSLSETYGVDGMEKEYIFLCVSSTMRIHF